MNNTNYPINNQKGNFILIIGVIVIISVVGLGAYVLGSRTSKTANTPQTINQSTPIPTIEDNRSKSVASSEEKILYEDNGISFNYPGSLEMYQTYVGDAVQWKPKNADVLKDKVGIDALTLHESENPLPAITKNGKFTIWNKSYFDARSEVIITSINEETVQLSQDKTTLYTIECGTNCRYSVTRFMSNKKYYEFIYNLASGGITVLKDILANLSFYDPNSKEWRSYTSKEGRYTVKYPTDSNFLEKVGGSVDGVRSYNKNLITIFPQKFSISFENIGDKSLDDYLKNNQWCDPSLISKNVKFNLNGEQAVYQETGCGIEGSSDVYVKHGDLLYSIRDTYPNDPILATLKFTD